MFPLGLSRTPPPSRGHQEKIRQRQSILPPPQGPAPIPFQHRSGDSPQAKNRVGPQVPLSEPGRLRGWQGLHRACCEGLGEQPPCPPSGFHRRESQEEEPRAVLAQKIEKETVGAWAWQVAPPFQAPSSGHWSLPPLRPVPSLWLPLHRFGAVPAAGRGSGECLRLTPDPL